MNTSSIPSTEAAWTDQASQSRYAIFLRRGQRFALSIELVRELLPGQPLTRVPRAISQVLGVLSLRGEILPVVNIDEWLGLEQQHDQPQQPILVVRRADLLAGIRVDTIQAVVPIPAEEVQSHPGAAAGSFLTGLWQPQGQAPITLIDGQGLLEALCGDAALNL
jgi:purine-binding chemotaxis protein CheW